MPCGFLYALEKGQYKYRKKVERTKKNAESRGKKIWQM